MVEVIIIHDPIPIIDGYITFEPRDRDVKFIIKVKQVKGRGVADADELVEFNPYHLELFELLKNIDNGAEFTGLQLRQWIKQNREIHNDKREFKDNNWMRPISEFYRKGIFSARREGKTWKYKLNKDKMMKVVEQKRFDKNG